MPRLSELMQRPSWIPEDGPAISLQEWQALNGRNLPADVQRPPAPPTIRCPMPVLGSSPNPDSLHQFYANTAPKFRINTPK